MEQVEQGTPIRLDRQVALVTGGGRGIGRAIALALAGAGVAVAVCARSQDQLGETVRQIEGSGGRAQAFEADMGDRAAVERLVARVTEALGPLDVLVNNAGVGGPEGGIAEADPDLWWHNLEINLRGPLYCAHAVLPAMLERGHGCIVNVASGTAHGSWPPASAYNVSKTALVRLTENLAAETRERGVAVFALDPGLVRTAMTEEALRSEVPSIAQAFQAMFDQGIDVPPERAARTVVFLASGRADALSGRFIAAEEDIEGLVRRAQEIVERDLYMLRIPTIRE